MSIRPGLHEATVLSRTSLTPHLVRIVLGVDGWTSTGIEDEWVSLVVPGQFQSRYYTVRSFSEGQLTLDVVVHSSGLVTEWAQTDCVGEVVTISDPKGSFLLPPDAEWVHLVGDLTALPAMARIASSVSLPLRVWAEVPEQVPDYFGSVPVEWRPGHGSGVAALVESISFPEGPGYFWMAGESAQMREIRRYVRRELGFDAKHHDLMGYWSQTRGRQTRAVDPGPIYARGKAAGLTDEQIWAEYDAARSAQEAFDE